MSLEEILQDWRELQLRIHENARDKGFYDDDEIVMKEASLTQDERMALRRRLILARLAMICSEVGEAVDAVRASDVNVPAFSIAGPFGRALTGTTHGSELADIVIRTMDLAEFMGIDLGAEVEAKVAKNAQREHRHGKLA